MPRDGIQIPMTAILPDLISHTRAALAPIEVFLTEATLRVKALVTRDGRVSAALLEEHQFSTHALSWLATYVEALRQLQAWAERLGEHGACGPMESLILQIGFGEYLAQIHGGIPMSQGELARLGDFGLG